MQRILILECVKFPPWGRVSAPAGVAPEALEECLHSSKGYKRHPAWLLYRVAAQRGIGVFQLASAFFVLAQ